VTGPPRRAGSGRTVLWLTLFVAIGVAGVGAALASVLDDSGSEPAAQATVSVPTLQFTVIEGSRREDVAEKLEAETDMSGEEYLRVTRPSRRGARLAGGGPPRSLEGFLFPATYELYEDATASDLVELQLDTYRQRVAGIDYRPAARKNLTPYDVLIIASLIEREVADPEERPLVGSVIYNRLRAGMILGIDATVQYAIGEWTADLSQADLEIDSPYNTRRYAGLPPGPIASPGEASIRAAADPADTDFLFYVARADGTDRHYFATTQAEHERNIARAERNAAR
jgi:UPF0755 protein